MIFVSLTDNPGGAEQLIFALANKTNSNVLIIYRSSNTTERIENGIILSESGFISGFFNLLVYLIRSNPDLIFSSHGYVNCFLGFMKRFSLIKSFLIFRESTSIFTRYNGAKLRIYKLLYRFGYPSASLVICQTQSMKDSLIVCNSYLDVDKVIVLHNPIDLSRVYARAELNPEPVSRFERYICSAGRLIPEKGFDLLIKAYARLADKDGLKLVILGEGASRGFLEKLIDDLQLGDSVQLAGFVNNPYPFFKGAEMCIVSSRLEGFPNVLLQMMALNKNVGSTLCAGGIEHIPGLEVCPPNNLELLSRMLEQQVAKTEDERKRNAERFSYYLNAHDINGYVEKILSFKNKWISQIKAN